MRRKAISTYPLEKFTLFIVCAKRYFIWTWFYLDKGKGKSLLGVSRNSTSLLEFLAYDESMNKDLFDARGQDKGLIGFGGSFFLI